MTESTQMKSEELLARRELDNLKAVLETEREALLAGDAMTVADLAREKEKIADNLARLKNVNIGENRPRDLIELANTVSELATLNHAMLTQMYQHYNGMVELLMRIAGQGSTYGRNGMIDVSAQTTMHTKTLA